MKKYRKVLAILLIGTMCAALFPMSSLADGIDALEPGIEAEEEINSETEPGSETESGSEIKPDSETEPDSEIKPDSETEPDSEIKPDSETESDIKTEIDSELDFENEIENGENTIGVPIDDTNFPDANFRAVILDQYDANKDKSLSSQEIEGVTIMTLQGKKISDLSGIHIFTSLKNLDVSQNNLSELVLNGCTTVETIDCTNNQLTNLDVRGCTALREIVCQANSLISLDLSGCPALQKLDCYQNKVADLNLSKCKNLRTLECSFNSLSGLKLKGYTSLEKISCLGNSIKTLDVSGCTALTSLYCTFNGMESLNVSGCKSLTTLNCVSNSLTNLDLKDCPALSTLQCYSNSMTSLNIGRNRILVDCYRTGTKAEGVSTVAYYIDDYGILQVDKKVVIDDTASVTEIFDDVKAGAWYVNSVQYVYDNGIMVGNGNKFKPDAPVKREEFVRVLYNHSKTPKVTISNPYADVVAGQWYEKSVLWAKEKNIANGKIKDGKVIFGVGQQITREELALMIYKYAKLQGYNMAKDDTAINKFSDSKKVSTWAKDAMNWAVSRGVMSGKGAKLDPQGNATRAECASMIKNMIEKTAPK